MGITKSTRYALSAAAEMAVAGDAPTTVAAVAQRYGIPEGALAKAFQQLVRAGIAAGTRGIGGGYRLTRPASKITSYAVLGRRSTEFLDEPSRTRIQGFLRGEVGSAADEPG